MPRPAREGFVDLDPASGSAREMILKEACVSPGTWLDGWQDGKWYYQKETQECGLSPNPLPTFPDWKGKLLKTRTVWDTHSHTNRPLRCLPDLAQARSGEHPAPKGMSQAKGFEQREPVDGI